MELLAPAGNRECLIAAVQSGADAVYLSGKSFGARSYADNFDRAELEAAADYCHLRGVRMHVTVNTLIADSELDEVLKYLEFLNKIGTDAVIVQDIAAAELAQLAVPDLPVHASTQMTIHNSDGVNALTRLGIRRAVLSRELSLESIRKISENCGMELEVFAHGALCMSYSGQCLMSSIIGGRSGNRGKCAQPCRLPYSSNGGKKAFYLSLKDLCTLKNLGALADAGVTSLKIEGRMKGAAYVAAVVSVYRKYLDAPQSVSEDDIRLLDSIFNRGGLTDGYITGKTGKNMFAFNKPDNPYRKNETDLVKEIQRGLKTENRKTPLTCRLTVHEGEYPRLEMQGGGCRIEYIYEKKAEHAQSAPLTEDNAAKNIGKTGGTPFEIKNLSVDIEGAPHMSASDLNAVRRGALDMLEKEITRSYKRTAAFCTVPDEPYDNEADGRHFVCEVTNASQLAALRDLPFELFYVPLHLILGDRGLTDRIKEKTVIVMPSVIPENECGKTVEQVRMLLEDGYRALAAMNISALSEFSPEKIYGGFRLNIFNSRSLMWLKKQGVRTAELSPELTLKQIRELKKSIPVQVMAYGRLPLMLTENCVVRNAGTCPCGGKGGKITDRMGMTFPVISDGASCRSIVLNCKKTFAARDLDALSNAGVTFFRLYFTDESADECKRVCDAFMKKTGYCPEDFTGAHFYKGVM